MPPISRMYPVQVGKIYQNQKAGYHEVRGKSFYIEFWYPFNNVPGIDKSLGAGWFYCDLTDKKGPFNAETFMRDRSLKWYGPGRTSGEAYYFAMRDYGFVKVDSETR